jgi:hypothetical protein
MTPSVIERHVRSYLRAKDENRPHLLAGAFAPEVELQMELKTSAIAFPASAQGLDAVADALVRDFARQHENVYSFCLQRPDAAAAEAGRFDCDWLVVMSAKAGGELRVGWGRYAWRFQPHEPFLVCSLRITIEAMQVLPPGAHELVYGWVARLPYPWCPSAGDLAAWPDVALLHPLRDAIIAARCS